MGVVVLAAGCRLPAAPPPFTTRWARLTRHERMQATRKTSGAVLNAIARAVPGLIGGDADVGSSNPTEIEGEDEFQRDTPAGRNLRFGVREHAMGGICNGVAPLLSRQALIVVVLPVQNALVGSRLANRSTSRSASVAVQHAGSDIAATPCRPRHLCARPRSVCWVRLARQGDSAARLCLQKPQEVACLGR